MAYECISRKKLVKLPRKLIKNCTLLPGSLISMQKAQARVDFHMKHKHGSDFKRLRIAAM